MNSKPRGLEWFLKISAFPQQTELCFIFGSCLTVQRLGRSPSSSTLLWVRPIRLVPGTDGLLKFFMGVFSVADDDVRKLRKDSRFILTKLDET